MNTSGQQLEVCPYDKSHMILKHRMITHLAKCSKNFTDCEKQTCPFNNKHVIPSVEFQYHIKDCPDRGKFDTYIHKVGDVECPVKNELPINIEMPAANEDWDAEPCAGSALAAIKEEAKKKDIFITNDFIGKSKSVKKGIRNVEVARHSLLKKEVTESGIMHAPVQAQPLKKVDSDKPIRQPSESVSTSAAIQKRLLKRNQVAAVASGSKGSSVSDEAAKSTSAPSGASTPKIPDSISCASRVGNSYASYLAKRSQKAQGETASSSNKKCDLDDSEMQRLTSSIFQNRGRGRVPSVDSAATSSQTASRVATPVSTELKSPTNWSENAATAPDSLSSRLSSVSITDNANQFSTDEHGFLKMPVPGKGRGKVKL